MKRFMFLNILGSLIEACMILFFVGLIFGLFTQIIFIGFYIILFTYQFIRTNYFPLFKENENALILTNRIQEFIKRSQEKKPGLAIKFVDVKQVVHPAFYYKNLVYINTSSKTKPVYLEGMICHELGHAMTALGDVVPYSVFRLSTILANVIYMTRMKIKTKQSFLFQIIDKTVFFIYTMISLMDLLVLHPLLRKDEYQANQYAIEISGGRSLRAYYYQAQKQEDPQKQKYDFRHPSISLMLEKMEETMNLSPIEKEVYIVDNQIVHINSKKNQLSLRHEFYQFYAEETKDSLYQLAINYSKGKGCEKDLFKAKLYYEKSIIKGCKLAFFDLGRLYEKGNFKKDGLDQAIAYYKEALNLQDPRAKRKEYLWSEM